MKFLVVTGLMVYFMLTGLGEWTVFTELATKKEPVTTFHLWMLADFIFNTVGFFTCLTMFWFGWGRK